ncbi:ABC transporter substrate-binding protein [Uliginosibacterium sediminicola]|uniref:ABC transporter substrate-binding protein n=1 Tax=Uliginosibacterium sediminicola TaxID=2024550 RepID=A0ABU9YT41_9RHOO
MNRRQFLASGALLSAALLRPQLAQAQRGRGEIVVGQSVDLSGGQQNMGRDYFTGAKIAFDQANAAGGTAGRRWRHIALDDGGLPATAVSNTSRLLKENRADLLFGFTNDECVDAVLRSRDFIAADRALFAPMSGLDLARGHERAVYLRASYAQEIAVILGRFAEVRLSAFAIAHTPGASSLATRDAALSLLRQQGTPAPQLLQLAADGSNATALATRLASNAPQAVVILADTVAAALLAKELRQRLPGLFVCVTSSVDATAVQQLLGKEAAGVIVSRVVPNATQGTEPVVREFSRALGKYLDEPPTAASLEGYLAARALIAAQQRLGEAQLINAPGSLRSLNVLDLGGWKIDFAHSERGSRYVDTSVISRKGGLLG